MTRPCVLDIKLGSQAYNAKKLERQRWKMEISTSAELGFRFCGISYYERSQDGALSEEMTLINKYACRSFDQEQMRSHFRKFLCIENSSSTAGASTDQQPFLVKFYKQAFEQIKQVLAEHSHGIRFYGSSILVIYCADSVERARVSNDAS